MKVGSLVRTKMRDCNGHSVLGVVEKIYDSMVILRFCCVNALYKHYEINNDYMRMFNPEGLVVIKE